MLRKVVFLDRDGVINRDSPDYVRSRADFEFLPKSLEAIRILTSNGYAIIVITNQSALARGLMTREELNAIHLMMREAVKNHGGNITDIFFCPHHPDEDCECRKPRPGLMFRAKQRYGIELSDSVMVGDSARDIECARQAGCGQAILVKSGYEDEQDLLIRKGIQPDAVCDDLRDAADYVLRHAGAI